MQTVWMLWRGQRDCLYTLQVERRIRELDRVLLMMRRSIRDKELAVRKSSVRIDERARHLNMDVCSDAMLAECVLHNITQSVDA